MRRLLFFYTLAALTVACRPADAIPPKAHGARMSYLDNGVIKLGVDLNVGGAVTYLAKSGDDLNVINSWDWGRQVQMSYYAGPVPFTPRGKEPAKEWRGVGGESIQAGGQFGEGAEGGGGGEGGEEKLLEGGCVEGAAGG